MEAYRTIEGSATARLIEKKSEFIAHAAFVDSEEAALGVLNSVRAQHRTANHNVYAYVLREGARQRYSDDGEPAKTSGLPTLEAILHAGLTDCILVTTRYFGGTLLGTGGLVRAYGHAAKMALEAARQVSVSVCVRGVLQVEYALYEQAAKLLQAGDAHLEAPSFAQAVEIAFVMPSGTQDPVIQQLQELCRGKANLQFSAPYYAPF